MGAEGSSESHHQPLVPFILPEEIVAPFRISRYEATELSDVWNVEVPLGARAYIVKVEWMGIRKRIAPSMIDRSPDTPTKIIMASLKSVDAHSTRDFSCARPSSIPHRIS